MDLGAVGLHGLVGSDTTGTGFVSLASDPETKHKWYGSGFLKQERSVTTGDDLRSFKLAKTTDDLSVSKAMLLQQRNSLLRSNATPFSETQQQPSQMLSFSSPKSEPLFMDKSSPNATLQYSYYPFSSYNRNTGYSSGSMHGVLTGARGPFTPSQWMELEHQALIYKYLTANVPVPSHLLIPIRKALDSAGFCNFSSGLLRPNALGWGSFHLGFSNNTDPEPGRCRRTDGKKWRCSRDAVVDQKYCERHMNRGRHRSRKPVEGQSGHAVTGTTTTTSTTAGSKLNLPNNNNNNAVSSSLSVVVPRSTASNSLTFANQDPKNMLHPLSSDTSEANNINRMFMNDKENANERMQDCPALPVLPPTLQLKPKENTFMIHKGLNQIPYEEESSRNEFGLVTSDSLLNPSQKGSTLFSSSRSFGSSENPTNREAECQHSLKHFIDDMQSERTQLSISIPMASNDFISFTSSTNNEKVTTLSPLRLSRELDPIQMGLGVGSVGSAPNEPHNRQANWIPISWENSMGGPLGEVLNLSNNNTNDHCANTSSSLNLMTDGWDNSPPLGSSPTGVLQKTAFGSLSNSSAGSSPRTENKTQEGAGSCNTPSMPAL